MEAKLVDTQYSSNHRMEDEKIPHPSRGMLRIKRRRVGRPKGAGIPPMYDWRCQEAPFDIYKKLFNALGPQGWWPLTPSGSCQPVHHPSNTAKKLTIEDRTEIIIGAILTQNTSWTNVEKALGQLHKKHLIDFKRIASTDKESLASAIRSSGYFNQKAVRLKEIGKYLVSTYGEDIGMMQNKPILQLRGELLYLTGIGPETADSIILYAFGKPSFVIDAYTRRIFSRIGVIHERDSYENIQHWFQAHLDPDPIMFKEYHALIVELAKKNCKKIPQCHDCPLRSMCNTGRNQEV